MTNEKEEDHLGSFYMGRMRPPPEPKRKISTASLAFVILCAFAAIVFYAYPKGDEKYAGVEVPVIKADAAPFKVKPQDPGGMEIRHQDSTVFDPLERKEEEPVVEKLQPLPEAAVDKYEVLGVPPQPQLNLQPETEALKEEPKEEAKKEENKPEEIKPEEVKPAEPAPVAKAPEGNRYIQLGSYKAAAGATTDWEKLKNKFPDLLGSLAMKTQKVDIPGKGTFHRLQAGPLTEEKARAICEQIKKQNAGGCVLAK